MTICWVDMTEADGVWSYTFTGLVPGDYAYNFFNGWGGLAYEDGSYLADCAGGAYGNDRFASIIDADVTMDRMLGIL